jgi:hypothetical protein
VDEITTGSALEENNQFSRGKPPRLWMLVKLKNRALQVAFNLDKKVAFDPLETVRVVPVLLTQRATDGREFPTCLLGELEAAHPDPAARQGLFIGLGELDMAAWNIPAVREEAAIGGPADHQGPSTLNHHCTDNKPSRLAHQAIPARRGCLEGRAGRRASPMPGSGSLSCYPAGAGQAFLGRVPCVVG